MAVRPASDWLIDARSAKFCDPLRIQRPGVGSASMTPCRYDSRSGARCTSSRTAPRGNCAKESPRVLRRKGPLVRRLERPIGMTGKHHPAQRGLPALPRPGERDRR